MRQHDVNAGQVSRRWPAMMTVVFLVVAILGPGTGALADGEQFFVPKPNPDARAQIASLTAEGHKQDAALIRAMVQTPQAVWIESNSPDEARREVSQVTKVAAAKRTVPVLVAYNIPFRDCAQFSAGGATTVAEYTAWIDGVAAGIGDRRAIVIVEPDGLGIIPHYVDINGNPEWCQPDEADPATAADDRFLMLNHAVDALKALPNTSVYLDGTHSAWLGVGDAADRLLKAGVDRADGFFLNASNYQFTANSVQYGNWISQCITYVTEVAPGDFDNCANQYWNGGPEGTAIADLLGPWTGVALSAYGVWSDDAPEPELNTSGINRRYADSLGDVEPTTQFVVDTSRNGLGPWQPDGVFPDAQDWCNPPDRGLGLRPTTATASPLVAAYLWIKIPGESDGECDRGTGEAVDPVRGMANPAAGAWFPEQALELVQLADPPLEPAGPGKSHLAPGKG